MIEKGVEILKSQTYIYDRSRKNSVAPDALRQKRSLADLLPSEQNLWYTASVDQRRWRYDTAPVEIDTVSPGTSRQKPSIADLVADQNALGSASTALEPEKTASRARPTKTDPQTTEARYITVSSPPPRVESFRKQRKGPYFKAQINANVYLSRKLGYLLLAGEPEKKGEELQIPVFHAFIGMEKPIGMLREDAHTFEIIDDPDLMSNLIRNTKEGLDEQ